MRTLERIYCFVHELLNLFGRTIVWKWTLEFSAPVERRPSRLARAKPFAFATVRCERRRRYAETMRETRRRDAEDATRPFAARRRRDERYPLSADKRAETEVSYGRYL